MLSEDIKNLINQKADDLNPKGDLAAYVADIIVRLNDYIEQKIELSEQQIDNILSEIVGFFTTSLHIPLAVGTKILRARSYKVNHQEKCVSELSYIPQQFNDKANLGRLNSEKQPVYYGCIYFGDMGGVNVAFSESNAKVGNTVNVLRSIVEVEVNVYYVGIYDHVHKQSKPRFISKEMFDYFTEVFEYQKRQYSNGVFLAHLLCDVFLSDILRRKESGNLYKVTSRLFAIFSESSKTDGIIYTSVKSEGDPIVALKTSTVDAKMSHISCDSYRIIHDYGYAIYNAVHTHYGSIDNKSVVWSITNV